MQPTSNKWLVLTKEISKEELEKWDGILREICTKKLIINSSFNFNVKMPKYLFYPQLYVKLWKRRDYIPKCIQRLLKKI